ncbi:MAG: hypothetical protein JWO26_896 [Rhodospirillales bacterium]|jgi:uncharacterized protein (DUF983 family)|nr:hypothetical protein [Rhodospirillales bacterium]
MNKMSEPTSPIAQWSPPVAATQRELPSFPTMIGRGLRNRCPYCGEGRVFSGYLKVVPACSVCAAPLGRLHAEDAPPYFTILLVGHLVVPGVFMVERAYQPPIWLQMVVWLPLFTVLCMLVLRPIKGAVVGWMFRLGMADKAPTSDG